MLLLLVRLPQVVGGTGWSQRVHAGPVTRWLGRLFLVGRWPGGELVEPPVSGPSLTSRLLDAAGVGALTSPFLVRRLAPSLCSWEPGFESQLVLIGVL